MLFINCLFFILLTTFNTLTRGLSLKPAANIPFALHFNSNLPLGVLKSEIEMVLDRNNEESLPSNLLELNEYAEIIKVRENTTGREAVDKSIKAIQRLMLMLDRSDGRPDFTPDVLANKYYDFVSTCLRSGKTTWLAVLAPLEYIGLKMSDFITNEEIGGENIRIVQVGNLCVSMSNLLLDLNLKETKSIECLAKFDSNKLKNILDVSFSLSRVAIRYAIFKESLEKHEPMNVESDEGAFSSLELSVFTSASSMTGGTTNLPHLEEVLVPSMKRLETLLSYDLKIQEDDLPVKGSKRVLVKRIHLRDFIIENNINAPA
eukprot:gene12362-16581_t